MPGRMHAISITLVATMACGDSRSSQGEDAGEEPLGASSYCEAIAPSFCEFYLRCDRMNVESQSECETVFLESCNSKFEAAYIELEEQGFMNLDTEGIAACEQHLRVVDCAQQVFELSGPCAAIWAGNQDIGESCGLDSEFFVCSESSECVLGLDFCGTCRARIAFGEACVAGEDTCGAEGFCDDGTCRARKKNGESCGETDRCFAGSACLEGTCTGPSFVRLGDACDRDNRCPYLTECISGRCEAAVLQGESCNARTTCATGFCEDGVCVPPKQNGSACSGASQCRSLLCVEGQCQPRPSACLQ